MPSSPKRKREQRSTDSSDNSSVLSLKRIKEALSIGDSSNCDSSFSLEDSIGEEARQHTGEAPAPGTAQTPNPVCSPPVCTAPVLTSTPGPQNTMNEPDKIIDNLAQLLDQKLREQRHDLISDMKAAMATEINDLKTAMTTELEILKGRLHDVEIENKALKEQVSVLWQERETNKNNVTNAKTHSILNDQYARRANIIVYGLKETRKENPTKLVTDTVKNKLQISLKPSDIEVCHRLGQHTLNRTRPMVVRFKFKDTKWDLMKIRKNLKGSGVSFGEDLCMEMRELQQEVKNHNSVADCWAWNGKLFAKDNGNKIYTIKYGDNWEEMLTRAPVAETPTNEDEAEDH